MAKNITAIVTGGGSGLGYATAKHLLEAGWHISIFDVKEGETDNLIHAFGKEQINFCTVDVTSSESVEEAVASVAAAFEIRLAVNCAGIAPAQRIINRDGTPSPLDAFSKVIDINLVGSFNICRVVASAMAENPSQGEANEKGLLVNTASVAGYDGQIGQCAYSASKGGIIGMTLPMARDLAPIGIRVNTIAPGVMGTPMLLAMPENVQEALVNNVQFPKRLGLPEEFGKLVMHLYDNKYLNGETIRLDGALRMPPK